MDFSAARTKMVDNQIRTEDVTDWSILRAFLSVPREAFVPEAKRPLAYIGGDVAVAPGRRMMIASALARLLQLAQINEHHSVLSVGCGTGYGAAIMSRLAKSVTALEEDENIAEVARQCLSDNGSENVGVVNGRAVHGWPAGAPYDRIVFEGAIEVLPPVFFDQLGESGRLVVVEGNGNAAAARLYLKEEGGISNRFAFNCSIPALPGFAAAPAFVF